MTTQQPQSLRAFLLKGCHHVSAQQDSVPAETTQCCHSMEHLHQPVSELCHLGCHLHPLRAALEAKHKDAQWLCLCSPAPLQQLPSQTAWLYFLLSNCLPPREITFSSSQRVGSMLWAYTYFLVNDAAVEEYFHKSCSGAQSCCTLWPWCHSPVQWDTAVNDFF